MRFSVLAIVCLILCLPGCIRVKHVSIDGLENGLPDNHGVVVAQITNNGARLGGTYQNWDYLEVKKLGVIDNIPDGQRELTHFQLDVLNPEGDTIYFAGVLPEGEYSVLKLADTLLSESMMSTDEIFLAVETVESMPVEVPSDIGVFRVESGRVANLGEFISQPAEVLGRQDQRLPKFAITRAERPGLWEKIRESARHSGELPALPVSPMPWQPDDHNRSREQALSLIEQSPQPVKVHRLGGNGFLLTGKLGSVYTADSELSEWTRIDAQSTTAIHAVAVIDNEQVLLGGEGGYLAILNLKDYSVDLLTPPDPLLHPVVIGSFNDRAYVLSRDEWQLSLHWIDVDGNTFEFEKSFSMDDFSALSRPFIVTSPEKLTLYLDAECHILLANSRKGWNFDDRCLEFHTLDRQPSGTLLGYPSGRFGDIRPLVFSFDDGSTWQESDLSIPWFESLDRLLFGTYRAEDGRLLTVGSDTEYIHWDPTQYLGRNSRSADAVPLLLSSDNGDSWEQIQTLPRQCLNIQADASTDDALFVLCENGDLLVSRDLGATWTKTFDRQLPNFARFSEDLVVEHEPRFFDKNSKRYVH